MRIGIDIDGTLTNIVDSVIAYGQEYELINNLNDGILNPRSDYIKTAFEWGTEIGNRFWRENFTKINQVEPRPLTKKYLDKLHQEGHEIFIITARTDEELGDAKAISIKWLKKNKIPFDHIFVNVQNKGLLCQEQKIDAFIDDLPRNIDSAMDHSILTFIMNSTTNENYKRDGVKRVYSFVDFYREIKRISESLEGPKTYVMNILKRYFKDIKNGKKTIEVRLNDIRRQKIKQGDIIKFIQNNKPKKYFYARVKRMAQYSDFINLFREEGVIKTGHKGKSIEQADSIMHRFYSEEEILKNGVVAIEIEKM